MRIAIQENSWQNILIRDNLVQFGDGEKIVQWKVLILKDNRHFIDLGGWYHK